jgi:hypothetical protein
MLSAAERSKFRAAQESIVDMLGVPSQWIQAKAPKATANATIGFKTAGWKDESIISAYGIGAKVITVKVRDIAVIEKFDQFVVSGERYTINAVSPIYINGEHAFHKCFVKGT